MALSRKQILKDDNILIARQPLVEVQLIQLQTNAQQFHEENCINKIFIFTAQLNTNIPISNFVGIFIIVYIPFFVSRSLFGLARDLFQNYI